jgi:hypothetical protein
MRTKRYVVKDIMLLLLLMKMMMCVKTIEIQCIMANRRNSQASLPLHPLLTSIGSEAILLSASTDYKHSAYMKTSVSFPSHSVVCVRALLVLHDSK